MISYLSGLITAGDLVAGLFFFRFWRRTGDSLFLVFGVSFVLFAVSQTMLLFSESLREDRLWIYMLRLVGFALILGSIVWKNVGKRTSP
jgi:uncharacterized membrane protein HdeD (DUF308 family)